MTEERIIELAKEHGVALGLRPRPQLTDCGDVLKWITPPGLTVYGNNLLAFARAIEATVRSEVAA